MEDSLPSAEHTRVSDSTTPAKQARWIVPTLSALLLVSISFNVYQYLSGGRNVPPENPVAIQSPATYPTTAATNTGAPVQQIDNTTYGFSIDIPAGLEAGADYGAAESSDSIPDVSRSSRIVFYYPDARDSTLINTTKPSAYLMIVTDTENNLNNAYSLTLKQLTNRVYAMNMEGKDTVTRPVETEFRGDAAYEFSIDTDGYVFPGTQRANFGTVPGGTGIANGVNKYLITKHNGIYYLLVYPDVAPFPDLAATLQFH